MPKLTFFNLPESKRTTLIKAAEQEFTRVPLFEASIANIIKAANIPRGSFYQYFNDKEDLYFYLLDLKLKENRNDLIDLLKKHNGDMIEAITDMYDQFLIKLPDEEEHNFLKNAFLYANYKVENSFMNMFDFSRNKEQLAEMTKLMNKQRFNIKDDQEFFHLLQIVMAIVFQNFVEKISRKLSDEEAIKRFKAKINLIKHGVYRNE